MLYCGQNASCVCSDPRNVIPNPFLCAFAQSIWPTCPARKPFISMTTVHPSFISMDLNHRIGLILAFQFGYHKASIRCRWVDRPSSELGESRHVLGFGRSHHSLRTMTTELKARVRRFKDTGPMTRSLRRVARKKRKTAREAVLT